jgi:hypothetical protein
MVRHRYRLDTGALYGSTGAYVQYILFTRVLRATSEPLPSQAAVSVHRHAASAHVYTEIYDIV